MFGPPTAKTTARGYDGKHVQARKAAARQHQPTHPCARCLHPLGPMGPWLHYDHNDQRTGYLGFSHGLRPCPTCGKKCNIEAGLAKGRRNAIAIAKARARAKRNGRDLGLVMQDLGSGQTRVKGGYVSLADDSEGIQDPCLTSRPSTAARW